MRVRRGRATNGCECLVCAAAKHCRAVVVGVNTQVLEKAREKQAEQEQLASATITTPLLPQSGKAEP
jgi:hypothetical protein